MPSSARPGRARERPAATGSPRARYPGRRFATAAAPETVQRPMLVPFAVAFGVLVAAEDGYFVWLLSFGWYLVVPALLAAAAAAGAALVWWGRSRGWLVLAVAAGLPLLGLLGLVFVFGALGGGPALWSALLLLIGPVGCLVLTLRRPVRAWCGSARATRSPGGRRTPARSR